ncbi:hypothetical protein CcaverHIS002_0304020 [Cutaneotrichosporon cavernicola]|uniref:Uncharacterized protein n=1 Tax=Cutaneotrichosporon cavernicola TaxID=279322 RepID=A0AA48IAZ3_9TREE|nr:uncharacterized protein CcaverHIS019_0304000 [Cutaneotrichosporon cavernicola]BEI82534.1 hypothetical protein CcaverHIS002_0304020 [Cutaneotrichosporon cavernicola]BEI90330.1 hypothetical protein CcaverHIS019_0304000 [Cutaneotrichosporon cavernicola]BEI98106.1 hypothetical protein CcaverHIS631_0304050 [Cutaneotrichosporon cavernicola]BEJ05883.1 hypothetical protein CcaverHIS641_0304050 [Cutaneotrichosporon cavernicola]
MTGYTLLHPSGRRGWLARPLLISAAAVVFLFCLVVSIRPTTLDSFSYGNGSDLYGTVLSAISSSPNSSLAWTDADGSLHRLGNGAHFVDLPNDHVVDARNGLAFPQELEGQSFNLAVLKLPPGSAFHLLGVARGPTRRHPFIVVEGHPAREQSVVVFGLDVRHDGSLVVVTKAHALDYQMIPQEVCKVTGHWVATYGPEDSRIFWTDAGTPAITFGRSSDWAAKCRVVGLIPDLRRHFPFVAEAIVPSARHGVAPYSHHVEVGDAQSLELVRERRNHVEKNWAAFYPGPQRDKSRLYPAMSYSVAPGQVMDVANATSRYISYDVLDAPDFSAKCVARAHNWDPRANHHASPLYRFTLCERGCTPHEGNTVNVAVAHAKLRGRQYMKYFVTYNTSAPFNLISIGPALLVNGEEIDDPIKINFALSMVPLEPADLDPTAKRRKHRQAPGHFFLDDTVLMTLGHADDRMISTTFPAREMLSRHKMCDELVD